MIFPLEAFQYSHHFNIVLQLQYRIENNKNIENLLIEISVLQIPLNKNKKKSRNSSMVFLICHAQRIT